MNKPDWKDSPYWANYLAQDSTGMWYWYEMEPWIEDSDTEWSARCRYVEAGIFEPSNKCAWSGSLEGRNYDLVPVQQTTPLTPEGVVVDFTEELLASFGNAYADCSPGFSIAKQIEHIRDDYLKNLD